MNSNLTNDENEPRIVIDPVCRMQLTERQTSESIFYNNRTYNFCSIGCKSEFQRHPQDYISVEREDCNV